MMSSTNSNRLWAITTLFYPDDNLFRLPNFLRFSESLQVQGVPLLVVQCLAPEQIDQLQGCPNIFTVRSEDRLWQKERLLNLALERLPEECSQVAWLDADVIFENPDWPAIASNQLESYPVVQPFSEVVHLATEREGLPSSGLSSMRSFFSATASCPGLLRASFEMHGHTGFAWVAQRSFLKDTQFYDRAIIGGGDHLLAHAFSGSAGADCIARLLGTDTPLRRDFDTWASRVCVPANNELPFVPGRLLHLWHGPMSARRYGERNRQLILSGFDPQIELRLNRDRCWEWRDPRSTSASCVQHYFTGRAIADQEQ